MQMLCALLIFDGPEFPAPLDRLSPWLDMCNQPLTAVRSALDAQTHAASSRPTRRWNGLPEHHDVTYVIVGRDPRDVAISFDHHRDNMDSSTS
jgi:hypothetical protein